MRPAGDVTGGAHWLGIDVLRIGLPETASRLARAIQG